MNPFGTATYASPMSLQDWLYVYRYMDTSDELRATWKILVQTYGLAQGYQDYTPQTPREHGMTSDDMEQLLVTAATRDLMLIDVLSFLLLGADPEQVVQLLTCPSELLRPPNINLLSLVASVQVPHAILSNPRITEEHLNQLEAAQVVDLDDLRTRAKTWDLHAATRRLTLNEDAETAAARHDPVLDVIFTALVDTFGEEQGL